MWAFLLKFRPSHARVVGSLLFGHGADGRAVKRQVVERVRGAVGAACGEPYVYLKYDQPQGRSNPTARRDCAHHHR